MDIKDYKYGTPYKVKALQTYSSVEWMHAETKKYRSVFDKDEVSFMRFHFSFYNKLFDEEDWEVNIAFKVHKDSDPADKYVYEFNENFKISKDKNVINIHESWGSSKPGRFWKEDDYTLEAYIEGTLVEVHRFYIYEVGLITAEDNPYFDFISLRLYESTTNGTPYGQRKYLTQFSKDTTRYVWVELTVAPKVSKNIHLEFFSNFFDKSGLCKTSLQDIKYVREGEKGKEVRLVTGWGRDTPGSWENDTYTIEVVFMENLIVSGIFTFGTEEIEGEIPLRLGSLSAINSSFSVQETEEENEETLEELMQGLNELVGLESVKKRIRGHIDYIDFLKLRQDKGFEEKTDLSLHSVFTGNPGTGKTTVVKMLGKIYQRKGLLSQGHVYEVDRSVLVGEFIGQTAPATKDAIKKAKGGILFIDEAYMLYRSKDDEKDFGKEALEVLIKEMSDGDGNIAIMFAGYPKETMTMINSNPGLKSRIDHFFHFEDYTPEELIKIADVAAKKRMITLSDKTRIELKKILTEAYRNRDNSFGNARFVYSLIDEAKMNMGLRIMKKGDINNLTKEEISEVILEDVKNIQTKQTKALVNIEQDNLLLEDAMAELNALVGMSDIKTQVSELVKLVRYYKEIGKNVLNEFSLHTIFTGNPGTGKTTVARIFGKIFKALGILERGHLVETGRDDLIAGFIGQTALKTKEVLDKAQGGVLFIDEAYALGEKGGNSYGKEAIEVILKNMEDYRGKFAVIAAGYPDNMAQFLRTNPGLQSRFDRVLHFKDYKPETLLEIAKFMLKKHNLILDNEAEQHLKTEISDMYRKRDKFFGNARTMRKLSEQVARNQNLRMADTPKHIRTEEMQKTITLEDLKNVDAIGIIEKSRKGLGF